MIRKVGEGRKRGQVRGERGEGGGGWKKTRRGQHDDEKGILCSSNKRLRGAAVRVKLFYTS